MFVTGLTYYNIIDREPAIADYIPDYATTLQTRIDEAKAVIDNRLRSMGYDLNLIGKKTDLWDWDNEAGTSPNKQVTNVDSTQCLLVVLSLDNYSVGITVTGHHGQGIKEIVNGVSLSTNLPYAVLLPYIDSQSMTFEILESETIGAGHLKAYLTDPAIYFIHLYKSLELIYETMRSAPGDLFEMKSNYYHNLYETEFNSLATYYDRNGDGTMQNEEMQHMKRTRILR